MSGRGHGRLGNNRGREGQGNRSRFNNNNRRRPREDTKKSLKDYTYYIGNSKQASDYETTSEFVINHIKKTFVQGIDIATALAKLTPVDTQDWKPSLEVSISADENEREAENRQYEIEFKELNSRYLTRLENYNQNLVKAYALIWERCSQTMKDKIATLSNFETEIEDDPINSRKSKRTP